MSDDDVQTLLSRATPRRANGDPVENEMSSVNSDVLLAAFDEIERLRARVGVLEKTLKHAASISHNGGLCGLSERDALIAVRRLTLAHWGREHGEVAKATVRAALEAKP